MGTLLAAHLLCCLTGALPEVADLLYHETFESGETGGWTVYDNWSKGDLSVIADSPLDGHALQVKLDDKSTVAHFDKGFVIILPEPLPWPLVGFIAAKYQVDHEVGNVRIFCHCDQGGWWDYTEREPVVGKPAVISARREDFRLAWTDDPAKPAPEQTGKIKQLFLSIHNLKPVNSGEQFTFLIDEVQLGTWLLPLPDVINVDGPTLDCWPVGQGQESADVAVPLSDERGYAGVVWGHIEEGKLVLTRDNTYRDQPLMLDGREVEGKWSKSDFVGREFVARVPLLPAGEPLKVSLGARSWSGRYTPVRSLTRREALALSFRTGAGQWSAPAAPTGRWLWLDLVAPLPDARPAVSADLQSPLGTRVALQRPPDDLTRWAFESRWLAATSALTPGRWTARASLTVKDEPPFAVETVFNLPELDREAVAKLEAEAKQQAAALSAKAKHGEAWWSTSELTTTPRIPDRERVDPAKWTRLKDPVTWADLGGTFQGAAQCGIDTPSLDRYFQHYDFGRVIKPHLGYFLRDGWKESLAEVKRRNLIVCSVWGYVPNMPWNGGFGEAKIPLAEHQEILGILGRQFLGYEMGEQDGRYLGAYAPKHQPETRAEARDEFNAWHQSIIDAFHGYLVELGSLNTAHDYARLGLRMVGLEASQGLPSDILEWAFLRGASKQWGVLPWNCISIFNRWGYKSYTSTGKDHGPDQGPTVGLLKRLWYATWLYGSASNSFESAYFLPDKDADGFPKLSPVGQCHVDGVKLAREQDRGVLYTPVAVMLDRDCGWVPPRHLYTSKRDLVWGNLPYSRADHATDAFFRWIWPKYEDCSYYKDERGFLTATPFGDMFDVIESDATMECLKRYQTIVVIDELELDDALVKLLAEFVRGRGELICDARLADRLPVELTGLRFSDRRTAAQRSVLLPSGQVIAEEPYTYRQADAAGAVALVLSEHGEGILWSHALPQGGRVITSGAACFVAAETEDPQVGVDVPLKHKLLGAFTATLSGYFRSLQLLEVEGGPVQVTCNVGANPNRLVLGLFNNETHAVDVRVRPRQGTLQTATPWVGQVTTANGWLAAKLPAGGLAVVQVTVR